MMIKGQVAELSAGASPSARQRRHAGRNGAVVPQLFGAWTQVFHRVRAARRIVLFLDFDGTLVPFAARPEDAWLAPAARRALRQLVGNRRVRVIVLSGRRRSDVMKRVGVRGVRYLGLYGWESGAVSSLPAESHVLLQKLRTALASRLRALPGIHIEDKRYSFSIHFRAANPASAGRAFRILCRSLREIAPSFRIVEGDKVWEIVPPQVETKAVAIRMVLSAIRRPFLVIYAGDTISDEEAFRVLKSGITIQVGRSRPTNARFRLRSPREAQIFLTRLAEALT
jgi:trehalose 6-phosphate phosphatase